MDTVCGCHILQGENFGLSLVYLCLLSRQWSDGINFVGRRCD